MTVTTQPATCRAHACRYARVPLLYTSHEPGYPQVARVIIQHWDFLGPETPVPNSWSPAFGPDLWLQAEVRRPGHGEEDVAYRTAVVTVCYKRVFRWESMLHGWDPGSESESQGQSWISG